MKNTCKTCKHWELETASHGGNWDIGECKNVKRFIESPTSKDIIGHRSEISFGEDFSCGNWSDDYEE